MGGPKAWYGRKMVGSEFSETPDSTTFGNISAALFETGRYRVVAEYLSSHKIQSILELGCGGGETTHYLHRFVPRCAGMDIVLAAHLKQNSHPQIHFTEQNLDEPFAAADGSFEAVVAMMVMEHVFDPFSFLSEIARVLQPGGILFLNVPLVTSLRNRLRLLVGKVPITSTAGDWYKEKEWDGGHLHYFSLDSVHRLLALYGFSPLMERGVGRYAGLKSLFPTLLAGEISVVAQKQSL